MLAAAIIFFHVATGAVVLVVAPAALLTRKGGRAHRFWGVVFGWAMAAVLATAAFMWQAKGHLFLLVLDVVCAYLVFEGFRVIFRRRRRAADRAANALDIGAAVAVLAAAVALFALAATSQTPLMRSIAGVLIGLGAIAAIFAALDLRAILGRVQTPQGSLLLHISAMLAAYISAVTAFCVINFHGVPMPLRWIVPSALGSLVIAGFSTQVRLRFARSRRARERKASGLRDVRSIG
jgi:uncharacterized membrane protein